MIDCELLHHIVYGLTECEGEITKNCLNIIYLALNNAKHFDLFEFVYE